MEIKTFSGMGNSLWVSRQLQELLASDCSSDLLWVFPVYSWGVPPVLVKHIQTLNLTGLRCHMVCTYGDEAGNIDIQWRKLIQSCGGTPGSIFGIQMPNTYVCLPFFDVDSQKVAERKLSIAPERVSNIATQLLSGIPVTDLYHGPLPGIKSKYIYPWFFKSLMKSAKFHHSDGCTGCGLCIRHCPQSNITPDADGAPQWGSDCAYCLRCYHICPLHAVAYGKQTARKGQYLHPEFYKLLK